MASTHFSWASEGGQRYRVRVRTPEVRAGTFYRLVAAIYLLHFDVIEGELATIVQDGTEYSEDEFLVEAVGAASDPARLGLLMESLLGEGTAPAELFEANGVSAPETRSFFEATPEIVFAENPEGTQTEFYIEALGRRGLLYHLASVIAGRGINIVGATVRTDEAGNACDTFYLSRDGRAIDTVECSALENAILGKDAGTGAASAEPGADPTPASAQHEPGA